MVILWITINFSKSDFFWGIKSLILIGFTALIIRNIVIGEHYFYLIKNLIIVFIPLLFNISIKTLISLYEERKAKIKFQKIIKGDQYE
ncbi:hypothetical protein HYI05_17100 [Clostridium botulinum]|nr:hypothetical protein [Clostridium botulinum]